MSGVGPSSINWGLKHVTTFPYMAGVCDIFLSMLGLPLVSILISGLTFLWLRTRILRDSNAFHRMLWVSRCLSAARLCVQWHCCSGLLTWGSCGWSLHYAPQQCLQYHTLSEAPSVAVWDQLYCTCREGWPGVLCPK